MANNQIFEKDKGEIVLKLRLSPRNVERAVFIIIILVLAYFAFFESIGCAFENKDSSTETTVDEETTVVEQEEELVAETENETVEEEPEPECGNDILEEDEECDDGNTKNDDGCSSTCEEEPEVSYDGKIHFTVNKIFSETGTYESSEIDWGKITKVRFTIDNQKGTFTPKVKIYTYTSSSSGIVKSTVRGERNYSPQKLGEKKEHTMELDIQHPFTNMDEAVTVKVVLIDNEDDDELKVLEEEYEFPS